VVTNLNDVLIALLINYIVMILIFPNAKKKYLPCTSLFVIVMKKSLQNHRQRLKLKYLHLYIVFKDTLCRNYKLHILHIG
jgi:hypothetical protein